MANRKFKPVHSLRNRQSVMGLRFTPSSSVTTFNNSHTPPATIAATGTGEFTITLADRYHSLDSCVASYATSHQPPAVLQPRMVSEDVDGAKTIVFELHSGVNATPVYGQDDEEVHVLLTLEDSTV